jgi:hypothetical protein
MDSSTNLVERWSLRIFRQVRQKVLLHRAQHIFPNYHCRSVAHMVPVRLSAPCRLPLSILPRRLISACSAASIHRTRTGSRRTRHRETQEPPIICKQRISISPLPRVTPRAVGHRCFSEYDFVYNGTSGNSARRKLGEDRQDLLRFLAQQPNHGAKYRKSWVLAIDVSLRFSMGWRVVDISTVSAFRCALDGGFPRPIFII